MLTRKSVLINSVLKLLPASHNKEVNVSDASKAARYINSYWKQLERFNPEDKGTLVGLPYKYIVPAVDQGKGFQFEEQYYWDSYITALGLTDKSHQELVEGMLENLFILLKRFGLIPNASRMYLTAHSQPPVLTSFIFLVYDRYGKSEEWLKERIDWAKKEYQDVWMYAKHPLWHRVHNGLSRYYDFGVLHDSAEMESGWDMTPRFSRKCLDFLPVDLNSLLYKYESDFARAADILKDKKDAEYWRAQAQKRKESMTDLMWGKNRKFFFDYNYQEHKRGWYWSLAAYYTMWAGLATESQAAQMVKHINKFYHKGGLSTTMRPFLDLTLYGSVPTQWAHPNGWAPLHYFVIKGLENYGYHELAESIAKSWLNTNIYWFKKNGVFMEKYNVVSPEKPQAEGVYAHQTGFGWTNGVFIWLYEKYIVKNGAH